MVISSDFRMGEHRDDDHEEDAPYFTISRTPTGKVNLDNQWWFGRNLTNGNGKMGLFPSNFIFIPRDIRQKFNITVKTAD